MNRYEDMKNRSEKHEENRLRALLFALVGITLILGFLMGYAVKADATPGVPSIPKVLKIVKGSDCWYNGTLNQYAVAEEEFVPILPPVMFFEEYHCRNSGIKFEVQVANNRMERQHIRDWFDSVQWEKYPDVALLCKKGSSLQHIALGFNSSNKVSSTDRAGWPGWVKDYTASHKCEVGR